MTRRLLIAGGLAAWLAGCTVPVEFDLVIRGGTVYDGGADPATQARQVDVGIRGDRITALGDLSGRRVSRIIDATGMAVAPGFIDTDGRSGLALLADGAGESHVRQGVTSEILAGPDTPAFWTTESADLTALARYGVPFDWDGAAAYFDRLEARGTAVNVGVLVPVGAARAAVMGDDPAAPSAAQLAAMAAYVQRAMTAGALGVSSTPDAPREQAVTRDELVALAREAGRGGGIFVARQRADLAPDEAVRELAAIAADADVPLVVADLHAAPEYAGSGGAAANLLGAIQRDSGRGLSATLAPVTGGDVEEDDVRAVLRANVSTIGSRSTAAASPGGIVDEAAYGTFPRVLGRYVRDESILTLPEALRRMTSQAATQFRVQERGRLREGFYADVVIFDPTAVGEAGSGAVMPYARGIAYVLVNGVVTVSPSGVTGARAGRRLLGAGAPGGR